MGSIAETLRPAPYGSALHLPAPYPEKTVFPLSLAASQHDTHIAHLVAEIEKLSSNGKLRALLDEHGAIYFQNLGLRNADEFSRFAHAFGWTAHEDIGNPVRRTIHAKNVATANEGPNTQPVYPHNEFGLSPHYPAYYCTKPLTLISQGVRYQLFYPNGPRDQTSSAGTTVLQAYGRTVLDSDDVDTARTKIEDEVKRLPTARWVWENQSDSNPLGDLRVWQRLPAVRDHPRTREAAFFNNVVSRFLNAIDAGTLQPPHINNEGQYQPPAFYGDGSTIPRQFLDSAVEIIKETRALVSWKEGNVLLLDNHAVQHGREPWTG
ncbi:Clavaminate synthase-like protein [Colletotrichum caudatum]|nr:Clavaminate synthase-like protein [Colletotrichum caudatum]